MIVASNTNGTTKFLFLTRHLHTGKNVDFAERGAKGCLNRGSRDVISELWSC